MKRVLRTLACSVGGLLVLGLLAFGWLVWQVDWLGRQDLARQADAILVFGARVQADGQPGPDLTSRTEHAVELWRRGFASQIICSGGFKNERLSAAAVCKRFANALGVPANHIWLADGTQNTVEDARAAADVMVANGWHTAIVVSHPLHVYRAAWLLRQAGVNAVTSPTSTQTDRIDPAYRAWYAVREAGAIILTNLNARNWLPPQWTPRLQTISYNLP